jgi:DNA-binding FadR family transcriptional regulator
MEGGIEQRSIRLGDDKALGTVKKGFMKGLVSKEEYAAALREHQAVVDATKSQQREEAEKAGREGLYSYAFYKQSGLY